MSEANFDIRFRRWYDKNIYQATVTVVEHSKTRFRCAVHAGGKTIYLEKDLSHRPPLWKLAGADFTMEGKTKDNAVTLMNIQDAIDEYLAAQQKKSR